MCVSDLPYVWESKHGKMEKLQLPGNHGPPWTTEIWRLPKSWGYPQFSSIYNIYRWDFPEIKATIFRGTFMTEKNRMVS